MYRIMDETEVTIRQIKDLRMVHFYNLIVSGDLADETQAVSSSKDGVLALAAYYGESGQMNLTVLDEHFDLLLEQVFRIYQQAEDKHKILADATSRAILDKGSFAVDYEALNRYIEAEGLKETKYPLVAYAKGYVLPIVNYYLKQLYHMRQLDYNLASYNQGWRGNCVIHATVDDNKEVFPMKIDFQDERHVVVNLSNFFGIGKLLRLSITYGMESIEVGFASPDMNLQGDSRYYFGDEGLLDTSFISIDGKDVYFETNPCEEVDMEQLSKLANVSNIPIEDSKAYKLPWGGYMVRYIYEADVKDYTYLLIDTNMGSKEVNGLKGMTMLRQWSYREIENQEAKMTVKTLGMAFSKLIMKDHEVQTHFLPVGASSYGAYKEHLEDRYFYEVLEDEEWQF